jgi:hypothetical protein
VRVGLDRARPPAGAWCGALINFAQNSGTTVIATKYDANSARHRQRQRREQEAADAVEKRSRKEHDRAGQRRRQHAERDLVAALLAATSGDSPISMWRKMFSSTITALSIRRENTSANRRGSSC